ncbi:SRPBCC family protein [Kineococcus glutinatus]|uniref:Coenzyme Q-binding protein COQ10 START domain-containing protein n=1 Tax=Kineococcus glutinatus TaxID=1070872 RepID=A0ABP9I1V5_9ACTN
MATRVEKTVLVDVPLRTVYDQWTQFEDFPQFMSGVTSVTQLGDDLMEWVAEIGGVRRRWQARVLEQVPDRKVAWAATEGATNAGQVTFVAEGEARTRVNLVLEYEPEGVLEKAGDALGLVERQATGDLERFKEFIESRGLATGAWRGSVAEGTRAGVPGAEDATASRSTSGAAGVSGKAVAAGIGVVAAAAAAATAAARKGSGEEESTVAAADAPPTVVRTTTPTAPVTQTPEVDLSNTATDERTVDLSALEERESTGSHRRD